MNTLTKKDLLRRLPQTWSAQYDRRTLGIYDLLVAEGDKLTEARAAEIIGNDSWTRLNCDECKQDCQLVVQLSDGGEDEYESNSLVICPACLQKAIALTTNA